jgi:hypothetical protein
LPSFEVHKSREVDAVIMGYPAKARKRVSELRRLVVEAAKEIDGLEALEETLKWDEPSFIAKGGSRVRIGWKARNPEVFAIYFKCTSKLVPTFKRQYGQRLHFDGNRAIIFSIDEVIPKKAVKDCIKVALQYHRLKDLPRLGMPRRRRSEVVVRYGDPIRADQKALTARSFKPPSSISLCSSDS